MPDPRVSLQTTRRSSAPVETTPETSARASGYPGACGTCFRLVHHDRLATHRGLLTRRPFFGECGWSLVTLHYSILVLPPALRAVRGASPTCGLRSIAFSLAGLQQPRFGLSTAEAYAVFVQRRERLCVLVSPKRFATCCDVRSQWFPWLLATGMPHTACLSPRGLLGRSSRAAWCQPSASHPTSRWICALPSLARLGLRALPFPISDGELVVQGRTAPPVSCSPAPVPFGLRLRQVS